MAYTYILKCADGSLYTGWTCNLAKRLKAHNCGTGAKYTRNRRPVELVYYEEYSDEHLARSRECSIKRLTRSQKQMLVKSNPIEPMIIEG